MSLRANGLDLRARGLPLRAHGLPLMTYRLYRKSATSLCWQLFRTLGGNLCALRANLCALRDNPCALRANPFPKDVYSLDPIAEVSPPEKS